ncbi:histidine phosphatase family protein [Candidatus Pelagibacter sp. Uisw_134_02]|jgi:phosphohistidine phosphatase SixA|uniref:histidine phosphatase family protein n=1 Tax=Candidatus Pelagibacter sp. Uisw_134_02 TaxID=3230990 RepID=UPI0039E7947A|tara:strand:+ start:267 stop:803 length:537 start_codon:yes stop_codon:yes gene_type:complete
MIRNFLFFIFIIFSNPINSQEKLINLLKDDNKLIFIRHAYAPGNGDPANFKLNDCSTQRNLNKEGINQSKIIGQFFSKNKIQVGKVLSSEWCRCKDTAKFAFNEYSTFEALNSFYDPRFEKNKDKQINDLKDYINNWNGNKNLVLITHFVVISEIFKVGASSGEIIISDKELNILARY